MALTDLIHKESPELEQLIKNAQRYEKVRRMEVREFQAISNDCLTYAEFDAKVDAYELM